MAKFENKEGFKNITEVRNFLYGTNNRKNSKVYLNIEVIDGYYHLCIWLDNNFTADEITGGEEHLKQLNGFKKFYQMKMNKAEFDTKVVESIQNITLQAWPEIYGNDNPHDLDSVAVLDMFRDWGQEFEAWFLGMSEIMELDYIEEIEKFTDNKVKEYLARFK